MKKKDREFLKADRAKRFLRFVQVTGHFAEGGPIVDPLPAGEDLPALRRMAARLRSGAVVPEDPSEDPRAASWKIERAVEQHLVAETIAADLQIHKALAEEIVQKAGRERELRDRAAFHRLKKSPQARDPESGAAKKVRNIDRTRRKMSRRARRRREQKSESRHPKVPRLRVPLRFVVGNPEHVFFEPFASKLERSFAWFFPFQVRRAKEEQLWRSAEVDWYGWKELQQRAELLLGRTIPHLMCTAGWRGVYLPLETEPCALKYVGGDPWPVSVGALRNVIVELERFGRKSGLPVDDEGLEALPQKTDEDDLAVLAYAQVLRAAHYASKMQLPLWVVR